MIAAIVGFIPALDRRLSIAIKSGTAAKVVPKPATKPRTSDRVNLGMSRDDVSCGIRPSQPSSVNTLTKRTATIHTLNLPLHIPASLAVILPLNQDSVEKLVDLTDHRLDGPVPGSNAARNPLSRNVF